MARQLVTLTSVNNFSEWREVARGLLLSAIPPTEIDWLDPARSPDMLAPGGDPGAAGHVARRVGRVPSRFLKLAQAAICHSEPDRFATLYALLWRLQKDRTLLHSRDDPDVGKLNRRVEQVVAEYTRMKGELRFRRAVSADGHKGLAASYAPRHYVLELAAPHFAGEIRDEHWVITTPYRCAYWDRRELTYGPGRG